MRALAIELPRRWFRRGPWIAASLLLAAICVSGSGYRYRPYDGPAVPREDITAAAAKEENRRLSVALARQAPRGAYIAIDRANNRMYLRQGDKTLLDAVCSSGSGNLLRDPAGDREWVFDTPAGVFKVRGKTENPVWRKPDWAFIEEGEPVPGDPGERIEYGVLGEYALDLGDGYLIHGTLYERLLGRSVTHGCVRLGRDDLRTLYKASPVGTQVFIF